MSFYELDVAIGNWPYHCNVYETLHAQKKLPADYLLNRQNKEAPRHIYRDLDLIICADGQLRRRADLKFETITAAPDYDWDMEIVSRVAGIDLQFVGEQSKKAWNMETISARTDITIDDIKKHIDLPWVWNVVVARDDFDYSRVLLARCGKEALRQLILLRNPPLKKTLLADMLLPWDITLLSKSSDLTEDIVTEYIEVGWDVVELARHPNLSIDYLMTVILDNKESTRAFCENPRVTIEFLLNTSPLPDHLSWRALSENKSISVDTILANQQFPWDYNSVVRRAENAEQVRQILAIDKTVLITPRKVVDHFNDEDIIYNIEWNWDFDAITERLMVIYSAYIGLYPHRRWNWDYISRHKNFHAGLYAVAMKTNKQLAWKHLSGPDSPLSWSEILRHHDNPNWDWQLISLTKEIGIRDIYKHPTIPWDWNALSKNPKISLSIIRLNRSLPWNWTIVSSRPDLLSIPDYIPQFVGRVLYRVPNTCRKYHHHDDLSLDCQLSLQK